MTLGERIKKYRVLKGLTQKELGRKALNVTSGADVRINQYEKDYTAPKAGAREALARELDIDVEALSDAGYVTDEDIMYILFALEEEKGLKIDKEDGKIHLVFDAPSNKNNNSLLTTYLNFWRNEAANQPENPSDEEYKAYQKWKGRFTSNVHNYLYEKEEAVYSLYKDKIDDYMKKGEFAKDTSDFALLLKNIVDSGLSLSTNIKMKGEFFAYGFSFNALELLDPPSEEAENLFAAFFSEIKHLNDLKFGCFLETSITDSIIFTYYIPKRSFDIVYTRISYYLRAISNPNKTDYDINRANDEFFRSNNNKNDNLTIEEMII